jgi:hypothetical protein
MAFAWVDYVTLARRLASNPGEAEQRAAASRAYYGAYCSARNKLPRRPPKRGSVHKWVWDQYAKSPDKTHRQIALEGTRLKRLRVQADYLDTVRAPGSLAAAAVIRANDILTMVATLP